MDNASIIDYLVYALLAMGGIVMSLGAYLWGNTIGKLKKMQEAHQHLNDSHVNLRIQLPEKYVTKLEHQQDMQRILEGISRLEQNQKVHFDKIYDRLDGKIDK